LRHLASAVHLFPLVGALIGLVAALVLVVATNMGLPPLAAAAAALGAGARLTGALHEDGLADTADALAAGGDRERALEIMRDSRLGSYGAMALVLVLLARASAIVSLVPVEQAAVALMAAEAVARAAMPVVMRYQRSARASGLAATTGRPEDRRVWLGLGIAAVLTLLLIPLEVALPALVAAAVVGAGIAFLLGRRFGGCTGDTLGAVEQATGLAFLLCLAARW
jgi:adenosylcobinamide-GDP ribazoletransferase